MPSLPIGKRKVVHRDICLKKFLTDEDGRGIFYDWDLARFIDTWDFISWRLFKQNDLVHAIRDDMESFVDVVFHIALRFPSTNKAELTMTRAQPLFLRPELKRDAPQRQ
ncbi:hypothetical protein D9615_007283 [Tricholomella constricta]|uniref:Uncharacterized protein n=1 Tax=Tricholomella constricta TaxID=117010 RepID=A0A8H5H522_9AGAR|nr:hypothetical protein D9615_007283 [Tricholomella constricta]